MPSFKYTENLYRQLCLAAAGFIRHVRRTLWKRFKNMVLRKAFCFLQNEFCDVTPGAKAVMIQFL